MPDSMIDHKKRFINELKNHLDEKIIESRKHLNSVIESRNSETKSTAGDKHETSRAMAQREIDMLQLQVNNLLQQKIEINQIDFETDNNKVGLGNLVITDIGTFLLSIAIGKIETSGGSCFAISIDSPMARVLLNKSNGDSVELNGRNILIQEII